MTLRRIPPHSRDSEESVLGGVLFHDASFDRVGPLLEPTDFYDVRHEKIFAAMLALSLSSQPIDLITVAEQMRRDNTIGVLSHVGSEAYLAELANHNATTDNLETHARIVRDKSTRRRMILALSQCLDAGYSDQESLDEYVSTTTEQVFQAAQHRQAGQSLHAVGDVLVEVLSAVDVRSQQRRTVTGVPTGFDQFDELTAGLQPSDLIILGARPSMGKTAFALNVITRSALDHDIPALIFSVEMSRQSLVERMLAAESGVTAKNLRIGRLSQTEWVQLNQAAGGSHALRRPGLAHAPITLNDESLKLAQLRTLARRWHLQAVAPRRSRLGLIVIDYLQLLPTEQARKQDNRNEEVRKLSAGLKGLAKELGVPVVVLSQLSRDLEKRQDKRPVCADLRDSGAIEQDADVILFLYRDWVYNKTSEPTQAELHVAKHRSGALDMIPLHFNGPIMRFIEGERA